ncbi:MAG: alanine--tRNA ligase [Candidatus Zixiibacteriota bacterium]
MRQSFIDYFKNHGHSVQPSSPVIPLDDPTLLFVNAGMNQFKDVFTGSRKVSYSRATTSQKCIRAGGKHNDLENVGQTTRHQTFFEMLGNFSFGDYFKEEAIHFAWEYVTKTLGLSKDRLFATVYEEDDEAFGLWEKIAPELKNGRILRFGKKDNYWSMGDVGPCGPCSEIHYDMGAHLSKNNPDAWINNENDRYIEFWNLVFMQFDQVPGQDELVPLPKPSVDTGAGLERVCAIMQGVESNFDTDLFTPLTACVADITGVKYDKGKNGISHRVIADHVRALSFALADGGGLSNEGRGYVLRRILRRAARHGRLLGYKEPIICKLVPTLIDIMGGHFTELKEKQPHIEAVIKSEEERFGELLDTGLELFSTLEKKVKSSGSDTIAGDDIFKLYDTYGFPVDMTAIMATEAGLKLDMGGFDKAMNAQREQSRAGSGFGTATGTQLKAIIDVLEKSGLPEKPTMFDRSMSGIMDGVKTTILKAAQGSPNEVAVVLEKTPFYVESGGQVGDQGMIVGSGIAMLVTNVVKHQDIYIHIGKLQSGSIDDIVGKQVTARIDKHRRKDIMRNHTATHLLHAALRQVLGDHVKQSGSLVEADRLRFDFAHFQALTPSEIGQIEKIVNENIINAFDVNTVEKPVEEAMNSGAMALFGEKYGDTVRVVSVRDAEHSDAKPVSMELCGGTHVHNTAEIGLFMITDESAIASGVRRIEAVTGRKAADLMRLHKDIARQVGSLLNVPADQTIDAVKKLSQSLNDVQKENKKLKAERFSGGGSNGVGEKETIGKIEFTYNDFGETDSESIAGWSDAIKGMNNPIISLAVGVLDGKRTFIASASKAAIDMGFDTGKHFGAMVKELGGRGGGKAAFARGGLPDDVAFTDLISKAKETIQSIVS